MSAPRKPYPSDVTDDEGAFVAPYLTPMDADAPQRRHDLRGVFSTPRWLVRTGSPRRSLPNDLPPWPAAYQQTRRWPAAQCFAAMADDLRALLRRAGGRDPQPTAVLLDGRTPQATPESGRRAGVDGHKQRRGAKLPAAVDTLGHLLAARVTPANEQGRVRVAALAAEGQAVTGDTVEVASVDRGATGADPAEAAAGHGIDLVVVRLPAAKRGFALLPRRGVVERSFAWAPRFRRLAKDYERSPETVVGLHWVAFACLMLHRAMVLLRPRPEHALVTKQVARDHEPSLCQNGRSRIVGQPTSREALHTERPATLIAGHQRISRAGLPAAGWERGTVDHSEQGRSIAANAIDKILPLLVLAGRVHGGAGRVGRGVLGSVQRLRYGGRVNFGCCWPTDNFGEIRLEVPGLAIGGKPRRHRMPSTATSRSPHPRGVRRPAARLPA